MWEVVLMAENYSQSRVPGSASASAVYAATRPELAEALLSLMIRVDDPRIHTAAPLGPIAGGVISSQVRI